MDSLQGTTLLKYRNYRYLKLTATLALFAVAAYVLDASDGREAYGGTLPGYVLGIAATLIVFVLMVYGVAKRSISGSPVRGQQNVRANRLEGGTLQGWLSAHIYLGGLLLVLATLHSGFQFAWNVHTLSYVLLLLVMLSGGYGLVAYLNYPALITRNMGEDRLDDLLLKIVELDDLAAAQVQGLPEEVHELVLKARLETRVGGNLFQQLRGEQRDCPTRLAAQTLLVLSEKYHQRDQPELIRDLYATLLRKEKLLQRARTDIMLKARMACWLFLHAPLAMALLAALTAHIVSVLFFW